MSTFIKAKNLSATNYFKVLIMANQQNKYHFQCFTCEFANKRCDQATINRSDKPTHSNDLRDPVQPGDYRSVEYNDQPLNPTDKYCINCSMFTCNDCTLPGKRHCKHRVEGIQQCFESFVAEITARLDTVTQNFQTEVDSFNEFAGVALKVEDVTTSFVSKLNAKLNGLVNTIELIRTNLAMATLQHAQTLQAQAAKHKERRKYGHIQWQRRINKLKLTRLCATAADIGIFKDAEYWSWKYLPSGNLELSRPIPDCFEMPAKLTEICNTQFKPVKKTLKAALSTVEDYAGFSVSLYVIAVKFLGSNSTSSALLRLVLIVKSLCFPLK